MHHMDAYKTHWEKARRELHKNAASYNEQILEATLHEITDVRPFTSYKTIQVRWTRHVGNSCRSKGELLSDFFHMDPFT